MASSTSNSSAEFIQSSPGEGLLKIRLQIDEEAAGAPQQRDLLLILVADQSGSMAGSAFKQVQNALISIARSSFESPNIDLRVVFYNSNAHHLKLTKDNYESYISRTSASGGTAFSAAFGVIGEIVEKACPQGDVVVGFMTDGQDCSNASAFDKTFSHLQNVLRHCPGKAVVHCVGFTADHNLKLLNKIRSELGKEEGGYQYAEPSDGPAALQQKLEAMFAFASARKGEVNICIPGWNILENLASHKTMEQKTEEVFMDSFVEVKVWIRAQDAKPEVPVLIASVKEGDSRPVEYTVPVVVNDSPSEVDRISLQFAEIESRLDTLTAALTSNNGQVTPQIQKDLTNIQDSLSKVDPFTVKRRIMRTSILEQKQAIQTRADQLMTIVGAAARGVAAGTSSLARLAELRYGAQFSKARVQRQMDKRAAANASILLEDERALEALTLDIEKAKKEASKESLDTFLCMLSQCNWTEIIEDKDCMGFGLAITRPEFAIDDPTQLRIAEISCGTFLSKGNMEDAMEHQVGRLGSVSVLGTFGQCSEMGVTLRGSAREPINAWLPLYINSEHWAVVRTQLRQIMGYFVTLDPFGFSNRQAEAMMLVLGSMIARLGSGASEAGERELLMTLQFARTCAEACVDLKWQKRAEEMVRNFAASPEGRTKDQVSNLLVLGSFVVTLPSEIIDSIFPDDAAWTTFWGNFLQEAVRRGCEGVCRNLDDSRVESAVLALLNCIETPSGAHANAELTFEEALARLSTDGVKDDQAADTKHLFSDCATVVENTRQRLRDERTALRVANQEAEKAKQESEGGGASSSDVPLEPTPIVYPVPELPVSAIPDCIAALNVARRIAQQMNNFGHPTLSAVRSLCSFATTWRAVQRSTGGGSVAAWAAIDARGGLAPTEWISEFKKSVPFGDCRFNDFMHLLGSQEHAIKALRAVLAQGLQTRVNKDARARIEAGTYCDCIAHPVESVLSLRERAEQDFKGSLASEAAAEDRSFDAERFRILRELEFKRQQKLFAETHTIGERMELNPDGTLPTDRCAFPRCCKAFATQQERWSHFHFFGNSLTLDNPNRLYIRGLMKNCREIFLKNPHVTLGSFVYKVKDVLAIPVAMQPHVDDEITDVWNQFNEMGLGK